MNIKKVLRYTIITIVVGTIIFLILNNFIGVEDEPVKEKGNVIETVEVDYSIYQKLRSEVYENETFAIIIINSKDKVNLKFRDEVLKSFEGRKSKIYELDTKKLTDAEMSGVINDITKVMEYDEPTIILPTLLVSKKGKIVYKKEGLEYSSTLIKELDSQEIE
jgi:hypothetical protein